MQSYHKVSVVLTLINNDITAISPPSVTIDKQEKYTLHRTAYYKQ